MNYSDELLIQLCVALAVPIALLTILNWIFRKRIGVAKMLNRRSVYRHMLGGFPSADPQEGFLAGTGLKRKGGGRLKSVSEGSRELPR